MDKIVKRLLLLLTGAVACCTARAQALPDPTRPPAIPQRAAPGASSSPAVKMPAAGPVLQSVLISRRAGGRRVAVIDGEPVALGGTFHGAVLVRVAETEVELRRGNQRQVLKLFPADSAMAAPAKQR
jgi:hypothetical protein